MALVGFAELLRRAQQGDEAAFTALFRDTQPILLRYLATLSGPAAEDIASETWVAVVRGLGRFVGDEPAAFRAWVLSIARRRWVDEVRRRARRPEQLTPDLPDVGSADDVASLVEARIGTEEALRLVRALPPEQAEVVVLRAIAGLDVHQVAELVGKTPGAVRVLAHRGLRRLAQAAKPGVTELPQLTVDE